MHKHGYTNNTARRRLKASAGPTSCPYSNAPKLRGRAILLWLPILIDCVGF